MRTLVVAECENGHISDATRRVITAMEHRGHPIDILAFSAGMAGSAKSLKGISKILCTFAELENPETIAAQLQTLASDYSMIVSSHRALGRAALPRAAAITDNAFLSDLTRIIDAQTYTRGMYAGSVVATVQCSSPTVFATVRASSFPPAETTDRDTQVEVLESVQRFEATHLVQRGSSTGTATELSQAKVIIAGGRGVGSKESMEKIGRLASNMGAALGSSRAAVDAGYAPNETQVGQTGKTVAPEIYVALGISGAIQHLAGMKDSKVIVAVNRDPDAPIFSFADYGVVGDLFEAVSVLEKETGTGDMIT